VHDTITALVAEDATTAHAVTVTVPTRRHGLDEQMQTHLDQLLGEAETQLTERADARTAAVLISELEVALHRLDRQQLSSGLWAGVTDHGAHVHLLDDEVEPAATVADRFDLMALVRQARHTRDALVLTISEPGARLYRYHGDAVDVDAHFEEVRGFGLPVVFGGEGARRGRETGSWQRDERYRRWLRDINAAVSDARTSLPAVVELPLIVVGIGRYLAFYGEVAGSTPYDLAIERSPEADTLAEIDVHVADALAGHAATTVAAATAQLEQARSANRLAAGFDDVAGAARHGRGQLLIVEEDADDAEVGEAVADTYRYGGQVVWAPAGTLGDQGPVVLITRW
jgi:hypothetical protein